MLTKADAVKLEVPPALSDRYVVRCVGSKFMISKKGNPMITLDWEIVGLPKSDGTVDTEVRRGDVTYQLAGLRVNRTYLTLVAGRAFNMFVEFQEKMGLPTDVDEENPDLSQYNGLLAEATLASEQGDVLQKDLTDEEKEAGKTLGDPILDKDGNELRYPNRAVIKMFVCRFEGEVPSEAAF